MRRLRVVFALLLAPGSGMGHPAAPADGHEEVRNADAVLQAAETEEDDADVIARRAEIYLLQHAEGGRIDPLERLQRTRQEYERRRKARAGIVSKSASAARWVSLGPSNGAGRMTSIAPHPTAVGTVYVGSAGGGVWKTADNGASWTALTDDLADISVGALAIAPSAPDTIYVGTGDGNGVPGLGLLVSTDGGETWTLPRAVIAGWFFRICVHPDRPQELVVGTDAGGFRSTDGGSTWSQFLPSDSVTDLVRSAADPNVLYAATRASQIWKSEDGGATWVARSPSLPSADVRLSVAMSPSDPKLLYAAGEISGISHIYKSSDGGQSWIDLDSVWRGTAVQHFMGGLEGWANTIAVLPGRPEVVVAGGVVAIRSVDGGSTWTPLPGTHADFHDLRSQGSTLWLANDGGIWTSPDGGLSVVDRNSSLVTRQYYALSNDPFHPDRVLAGAQDNGTSLRTDAAGTGWRQVGSGDGFDCEVSSLTPDLFYTSEQYGTIYRLDDSVVGSGSAQRITPPYPTDEPAPFHTLLVLDPQRSTTIYTGSTRVWRSTDGGDSWVPLPTTSAAPWTNDPVSAIAVAPSDPSVLMVGKGRDVYRSADAGQTWILSDTGLPGSVINRIAIDPTNASIAYAAFATTTGLSVYGTSDGGAHWGARSNGLPPFAALVVRVDPANPAVLYCGTEGAVYRSADRGASWSTFGDGLPATSVQDLRVSDDGSQVRIATYGRGVWELETSSSLIRRDVPVLPCPGGGADCSPPRPRRVVPPGD